jgi:hypothetical protein
MEFRGCANGGYDHRPRHQRGNFQFTGNFTTGSQFFVQQLTGNPTGGVLFEARAADADVTVARFGDGTNYIQIGQTGALTTAGTASLSSPAFSGTASGSATIPTSMLTTEVRSMYWGAGAMSADGTQCANPTEVTLNSGPKTYSVICTDNDAATLYGHTVMPEGWTAGTVEFALEYVQTAANTSAMNSDVSCACRGPGETINNTFGTEQAIDDAAVTGSNGVDLTKSSAVTCDGTCAAGDTLFWRWQLDATGTTTAVATLNMIGMRMEYTTGVGD